MINSRTHSYCSSLPFNSSSPLADVALSHTQTHTHVHTKSAFFPRGIHPLACPHTVTMVFPQNAQLRDTPVVSLLTHKTHRQTHTQMQIWMCLETQFCLLKMWTNFPADGKQNMQAGQHSLTHMHTPKTTSCQTIFINSHTVLECFYE